MSHFANVVEATKLITLAVREAGSIPSGHLYARMMPSLPNLAELDTFEAALRIAVGAGLVKRDGHELRWCGPTIQESL